MSEENCRRIAEETHHDASNRCKRFGDECPECECESYSFGNGSPGIVAPEETLVRFHFSGHDIDDEGRLTTAALTDVVSVGLSVTRNGASHIEIELAISGRIAAAKRLLTWHSVSLIPAAGVKKICRKQEGKAPERCFCVYDTAVKENRMHAEICGTKAAARKARKDLRDLCHWVQRKDYRQGALMPETHLPPSVL